MHPVPRERLLAGRILGLGDLAFVMREDEVGAAAVDVERIAEIAIDMALHSMCQPGRPGPHGRVPGRFAGLGRLPEHEVERILLVRIVRGVAALVGDRQHFAARNVESLPNSGSDATEK